ncbi:MAG TPA: hypothetical protein VKP69_09890, partial [Isosphaeraceae bacterium]|nr:hypothetical protein [Isosphaeraceae bacterium]
HLYRAMAWLGEELPTDQQKDKTPFAPRCIKDRIEEGVFNHRRDLFSGSRSWGGEGGIQQYAKVVSLPAAGTGPSGLADAPRSTH